LIFIKRLSDVYEDELARLAEQLGDVDTATEMAERDHGLVRFFLPRQCLWPEIRKLLHRGRPSGLAMSSSMVRKMGPTNRLRPTVQERQSFESTTLTTTGLSLSAHRIGFDFRPTKSGSTASTPRPSPEVCHYLGPREGR